MEHNNSTTSPSPRETINTIEKLGGTHPGFRRAHAKGIGLDGIFTPNNNAKPFTKAAFLVDEPIPVIVRFSHSAPMPNPPERLIPIKGMAVQFLTETSNPVSLVMANVPIFPTKTPEAFVRLLQILSEKDVSFPERLKTLQKDTELHTVPQLLKKMTTPASFAVAQYWALHAFILETAEGDKQAVRFSWIPASKEWSLPFSTGDMEAELLERMADGPVEFNLLMTLATHDDPTDDPSIAWPDERLVIDVGRLTLTHKRNDNANNTLFDPTAEIPGFSCSDDPILQFRSPVYHESMRRRSSEQ